MHKNTDFQRIFLERFINVIKLITIVTKMITILKSEYEKYKKLPRIRKNAIASYINKLPEIPVFIILFGSTAKETYKKKSRY